MLKKLFTSYYNELLELMNCLKVGVYITDGDGNTLLVNDESCKTGGLTRDEVIGKNMAELEREGFIKESITLKTLKSGKAETMIQDLGDGGKVFTSSQPKYVGNRIAYVITTERDITETLMLREVLEEKNKESIKYEKEIEYLKDSNISNLGSVVAVDEASKLAVKNAIRVAALDTSILLTGESGTGKEVYANLIYKNSKRVGKPFIKVNTAALPETLLESEMFGYERGAFTGAEQKGKMGYFELANGGTLFLDEIGEMPVHVQSKLLRVLQEKEVVHIGGLKPIPLDIRLIAATNTDLKKAMEEGRFRKDLYYRLAIMPIDIPPLRDRKADIPALSIYFTQKFNKKYKLEKKLEASAINALEKYEWPGNIRELQNVLERAMISFDGETITAFQIERLLYPKRGFEDEAVQTADNENGETERSLKDLLEAYEKRLITAVLCKSKNASEAGRRLGIQKSTLSRRIKKYGLDL